jgi:hypothetical protein
MSAMYSEEQQDRDYRDAAREFGCTCPDQLRAHTHAPNCPLSPADEWKVAEVEADIRRDRENPMHTAQMLGVVMIGGAIVIGLIVVWAVGKIWGG